MGRTLELDGFSIYWYENKVHAVLPTAGLYQHALLLPGIQEPALWSIPAESAQNVHEILQALPPGVRNQNQMLSSLFVLGAALDLEGY